MGIRQLSSASAVTGAKSNKFWDQSTYVGDFVQIASAVVTSGGTASVTFSGIHSTFTHLQIRSIQRTTAATTVATGQMIFNADGGSNYRFHLLYGTGATAAAYASPQTTYMGVSNAPGTTYNASMFCAVVVDILDAFNTNKYKTVRTLNGYDVNASGGELDLMSGVWMNTNAISSITLTPSTGNWAEYSSFALYGVR